MAGASSSAGASRSVATEGASEASSVYYFKFEVFGRVQGVFFRKHTIEQAKSLGIDGWIRNTWRGTVEGEAEAPSADQKLKLQTWLQKTGSPSSRIERAVFEDEKEYAVGKKRFTTFKKMNTSKRP